MQVLVGKMLDFFTIFSKGGIVLWCFQGAGVTQSFTGPVNALIRSVILQVTHNYIFKQSDSCLFVFASFAKANANG